MKVFKPCLRLLYFFNYIWCMKNIISRLFHKHEWEELDSYKKGHGPTRFFKFCPSCQTLLMITNGNPDRNYRELKADHSNSMGIVAMSAGDDVMYFEQMSKKLNIKL